MGNWKMAEKLDPKELFSFKELLMFKVIQSDALINLLDRKGIITKKELLEEMKRVQASIPNGDKHSECNIHGPGNLLAWRNFQEKRLYR